MLLPFRCNSDHGLVLLGAAKRPVALGLAAQTRLS
jgi:hypothetical protein